ncbi:MAG TPA: proton-conducting transporter membrane subunit, partial [Crinalium sp.]
LSPVVMATLVWIGGITAIGGALIAIAQIDLKRTLSYSVSAYMGLVFIAVGTGQSEAALLLVLTHAVAIALLVMSLGAIIWNSITQDITQLGGLWSRRPVAGLAFLVGTVGLIALPPFGSFWALLKLADGLWATQPWLVGLVLLVNGLTAFSLARVFSRIFGGQAHPMAQRSPEVPWTMALPTMVLLGVVLHTPIVLQALSLLPVWTDLNKDVALLLLWSSAFGGSLGAVVYLGSAVPKPVQFPWKPLQDLLSYDFYTAQIYRMSIVLGVDLVSRLTSWFDRYLVDGFINFLGIATLFGGEGLKYSTSGRGQSYALTIVVGAVLVGCLVMWSS